MSCFNSLFVIFFPDNSYDDEDYDAFEYFLFFILFFFIDYHHFVSVGFGGFKFII